jgi:hypothetical protein
MTLLYMVLSFVLVIGGTALFWKLAARILRYSVTWPRALLIAATIVFALGFVRGVLATLGVAAPMQVAIALSLPLPIALGAWCVHDRATHRDGTPLDWLSAFKLSGLALALNVLFAVLLIGVALTI